MRDLRHDCTGESFGKYYGVRINRREVDGEDRVHIIYLYADRVEVKDKHLCFYKNEKDGSEMLCRAFAFGTWREHFAASMLDGTEMWEDHDYVREKEND